MFDSSCLAGSLSALINPVWTLCSGVWYFNPEITFWKQPGYCIPLTVQTNWTEASSLCAVTTEECFNGLNGPVGAGIEKDVLWKQHELQTSPSANGVNDTYSIIWSIFTAPDRMPVEYYVGGTYFCPLPQLVCKQSVNPTIALPSWQCP